MILKGVDSRAGPSFSLKNRLLRSLWLLVYKVAFRPSPIICHSWRRWLLRLFGARVGRGTHIYPAVKIWAPWNLHIGSRVGVANDVTLYSMGLINLGDRCVVSQGAHLCAGTHDYNDPLFQLIAEPISVGADTWICAEVFIMPGINIAEGVVVGARSVVSRNLNDSWSVYAGMPARKVNVRQEH